ncbi:MAG: K+/H+ antiporter subunit F [Ideonella sp.]|nr:K+/H+ antiporter subunit F [Ideonella sp.]MBP6776719.1 K+/H+ antiporter subunit F [Piscinibacter sp.]
MILQTLLPWIAALFALGALLNAWRLIAGPTLPDRILALDTLAINALAVLVLIGIWQDTTLYFEVALLIALLGFVSTVALAKFVARGNIVE